MDLKTTDINTLIKLFSDLEKIKQGYEDTIAFVINGKVCMCNLKREKDRFIIDDKPVSPEDFWQIQEDVCIEIACRGISIHIRPPHKRKPKK